MVCVMCDYSNIFSNHLVPGVFSPPLKFAQGALGQPSEGSSSSKSRKNSKVLEGSKEITTKTKSKDAVFKIVYADKVCSILGEIYFYSILPKKSGHDSLQKTRSVDWFTNIFHMNKVTC